MDASGAWLRTASVTSLPATTHALRPFMSLMPVMSPASAALTSRSCRTIRYGPVIVTADSCRSVMPKLDTTMSTCALSSMETRERGVTGLKTICLSAYPSALAT